MEALISVIIPVYNVEHYLRQCLNSVVGQTYRNLEILIINDGSTDGSGSICDEYKKDGRVRVFHTENRGLSVARNLGLDEAQGEWVGFVDSDDWIEPDMYECLIVVAEKTDADVTECGVLREHPGRTVEHKRKILEMSGMESVRSLLRGELAEAVWNKLWNRRCFEQIRFPENRIFEEYATTWRVFIQVDHVCTVDASKYHYRQREGNLSRTHDMKNLVGYWLSPKERYEALWDQVDETSKRMLLRLCAMAVSRTWAYCYDCTAENRDAYRGVLREMNTFSKHNLPLFGDGGWSVQLRFGVFFPHFYHSLSFRMAWLINRLFKRIKANSGMDNRRLFEEESYNV